MRSETPTRIGLLGGTFNPVHRAHLALARAAMKRFRLDRVLFIPCARPPHKRVRRLAPARHRVAMLRAAIRGRPGFGISDVEIKRGGVSYSIDTLRALRRRHPGAEFCFLIGADMARELPAWKDIHALGGLCRFAVSARPGVAMPRRWPAGVRVAPFRARTGAVSSSDIRERISRGLSIRGLVPPAVEKYIRSRKLYRPRRR